MQPFALLADPRIPVNARDLQAQFDLKMAIRERSSETHTAINQIRRVRQQVEDVGEAGWPIAHGGQGRGARAVKEQLRPSRAN